MSITWLDWRFPFGSGADGDWRPEIALTSAECVAAEWRWDAVPGSDRACS